MSLLNNNPNIVSNIKFKYDLTTPNTIENYGNFNKNLNNIFSKQEHFNYSSILLNSDRESLVSNQIDINECAKTPENLTNQNLNLNNNSFPVKKNKNVNNLTFSSNNKQQVDQRGNFNVSSNKFSVFYNKLKYDEMNIKDIISYSSTLFELKEFLKCSNLLKSFANTKYPTAMFLYYFSEYMIIQQKKQEEMIDNADLGSKYYSSKELNKIYQILLPLSQNNELSAFMEYLYGVILKDLNMMQEAKVAFIKSLNQFPMLWSAWAELCLISKQTEMVIITYI